jgi:hypothetical protein
MATRKKSAPEVAPAEAAAPETPAPAPSTSKKAAPKAEKPAAKSESAPAPRTVKPKKRAPEAATPAPEAATPAPEAEAPAPEAAMPAPGTPVAPKKAAPKKAAPKKTPAKPGATEPEPELELDPEDAAEVEAETEPAADPPRAAAPRVPYVAPMAPLPDAFGTDRVVIMARDPESAFIYWEVTDGGIGRARAALGDVVGARLNLRIYVGEGADARFEDHGVSDWLGRFTFFSARPGLRLAASVGYLAENVFVHITQSLPARLPRRGHGNEAVRFVRVGPRRLTPPQSAPAPVVHALPGAPGGPPGGPGLVSPAPGQAASAPAGSHNLVPGPEPRR